MSWPPSKSGPVIVRFVMHPGSPGQHMFKIGARLTDQRPLQHQTLPQSLEAARETLED